MTLKPQDVLVALKLWTGRGRKWTYPALARSLGLSVAEAHASVRRAAAAGFLLPGGLAALPNQAALLEFLVHGAKYAFPVRPGELTRGIPTAHAAPPLAGLLARTSEPGPVWPQAEGRTRGSALEPLYRSVPAAASADPALYEILALLDAVRAGRARERQAAVRLLQERLR